MDSVIQYQVYNSEGSIKLYFDLDFNLRGFRENEVSKKVKNEIKKHLTMAKKS